MTTRGLAVCTGHRCAALLAADGDGWCDLRAAVQGSRAGVLVSTGCTGSCARGPVVALSQHLQVHRDGPGPGVQVQFGAVIWLGPVGGQQLSALCQWLGQDQGSAVLPRSLRPAVFVPQPTGASSV